MRLFVYGTLLDPACVTRLTGRPARLLPATLHGYWRVRLRGTPYATLARGRGPVRGAILLADRASFLRLHAYEGRRYRLTAVSPRVAGRRAISARAWIAPCAARQPFR